MGHMLDTGVFLLSIDTEMAWGGVHNGTYRRREPQYRRVRRVVERLLALMERHRISATWAFTGHLLLEHCAPVDGVKHPEIVRPAYRWFRGDWFDADPCADRTQAPSWYGADLLERVLACPVPQEVGCHGFSHLIVGDPGCSRQCFASELRAAQAAAAPFGMALRSFVFPRNAVGHLDALEEAGYLAYRGVTRRWFHKLPGPLRRMGNLAEHLLPLAPPTPSPIRRGGLWDLGDSQLYLHRQGLGALVPVGLRVLKAQRGLRRAAQRRALFHLWFHPFNLAVDMDALMEGLDRIFEEVARLRAEGRLENVTMGALAARLGQAVPAGVVGT